jgi:hypothetical protein
MQEGTWWFIPRIVSRLYTVYRWSQVEMGSSTYNCGYTLLTK